MCKVSDPNKITFKEFSAMVVEIDASDCPDERKMRESLFKMDSHMGGGFSKLTLFRFVLRKIRLPLDEDVVQDGQNKDRLWRQVLIVVNLCELPEVRNLK